MHLVLKFDHQMSEKKPVREKKLFLYVIRRPSNFILMKFPNVQFSSQSKRDVQRDPKMPFLTKKPWNIFSKKAPHVQSTLPGSFTPNLAR